jgi:hypothetical protein
MVGGSNNFEWLQYFDVVITGRSCSSLGSVAQLYLFSLASLFCPMWILPFWPLDSYDAQITLQTINGRFPTVHCSPYEVQWIAFASFFVRSQYTFSSIWWHDMALTNKHDNLLHPSLNIYDSFWDFFFLFYTTHFKLFIALIISLQK